MKSYNSMNILLLSMIVFLNTISCKKDEPKNEPQLVVTEDAPVTDIDGNTYKTVKIAGQIWMAENFKAVKTANGQNIQEVYVYDNNNSNATNYGRLYTWLAAVMATPTGWHLPTKEEWDILVNALGGDAVAGGKLKELGTNHWSSPNTGATNSSGLALIGGGFRGGDGVYYTLGEHGSYWGSANNALDPYCIYSYNNRVDIVREVSQIDKTSGIAFAVRYVKD